MNIVTDIEVTTKIEIKGIHLSKASILIFSSFSLSRDLSISFSSDCRCMYMFFSSILKGEMKTTLLELEN